jgi:hypothetical protein
MIQMPVFKESLEVVFVRSPSPFFVDSCTSSAGSLKRAMRTYTLQGWSSSVVSLMMMDYAYAFSVFPSTYHTPLTPHTADPPRRRET